MAAVSVIILTYNESLHLARCIQSLQPFAAAIFVVDSFSTDDTVAIAESLGAKVYQHTWVNYAVQFQWGLDNCPIETTWVMRMDADEYVTPALAQEIQEKIPDIPDNITGIVLKRRVYFMDRWIQYGGYYPIKLLRIWRSGVGTIEQRWMDEHVKLSQGQTIEWAHDIVDHNLNNLSWWTQKHNQYATREAVDLLNMKYGLFERDSIKADRESDQQNEKKRWYKDNLYARSPLFLRAVAYFFFRYFIKLGFLDGKQGLVWHVLQGLWYRFLVDAKIYQIEYLAKTQQKTIRQVLVEDYDFKL